MRNEWRRKIRKRWDGGEMNEEGRLVREEMDEKWMKKED